MAFVYVIAAARDVLKIGIAGDVQSRLKALSIAAPFGLSVVHQVEVFDADARAVEARIHLKMRRHRLRGEWFKVERSKAVAMVNRIARASNRVRDRARASQRALDAKPGTVTRNIYCQACFHRGAIDVPLGTWPKPICSACGNTAPLIAGRDPIRPWWEAKKAAGR